MAKGKSRPRKASTPVMAKPPSMKDTMSMHADSAARSVMEQHPLHKQMRKDMMNALMSVAGGQKSARGPAARGRQRSVFQ